MLGLQSLDIAHDIIRERLQQAAADALGQQVPSTSRSLRQEIARGLRALAVHLDPSLSGEARLAIVPFPR
jgi:hypothetical protein